jgi:hypothetical protein
MWKASSTDTPSLDSERALGLLDHHPLIERVPQLPGHLLAPGSTTMADDVGGRHLPQGLG